MLSPVLRWQFFSALDDDEKAQVSTPPEPCPQGDSNRARTVPEGWRSGPVQEQDLDLNLQREQERHPAPVAGPSTSADLLAPGRDPSLLIELDGIVANLVDLHGSEKVEAAMQRLTDDRRRFPWPSDARKALEAILGVAPLEAKAHPLDEAQRAQRDMAERDQDAWLRTLEEANAAIPADPAARSEVLAKTRAKLQGKSA
jgi:hypothetical protein